MRCLCYITTFLVVGVFPSIATPIGLAKTQGTQGLSYSEISSMIKEQGAKETVKKLYGNPNAWNGLLLNIASGKREWLNMAVQLKAGADAGISGMLKFAVGEALENAPELVLQVAADGFSLEDICGSPDVDDVRFSTYEKALESITRRIEALEEIRNQEIGKKRQYCIEKLKESISRLQQFYGVK